MLSELCGKIRSNITTKKGAMKIALLLYKININ